MKAYIPVSLYLLLLMIIYSFNLEIIFLLWADIVLLYIY